MKLYLITFISLLLSLVAKGQTNGLNGGTIRPLQTITEVTSSNGSVTIVNPFGPIIDLSVVGGGGTIVSNNIVNINTTNGNFVITNGGISITTTNGSITITNSGGGLIIINGTNIFLGSVSITNGSFSNVSISNGLIYNTTLSNITIVGGTVFNGAISNLTATPNQVAWWDANQSLVSTNVITTTALTVSNGAPGTATNFQTSSSISITNAGTNVFTVDTNNGVKVGGTLTATNITGVTNITILNKGAINFLSGNSFIGTSNGFMVFGNGSGIFGFGQTLGMTDGTILSGNFSGNNFIAKSNIVVDGDFSTNDITTNGFSITTSAGVSIISVGSFGNVDILPAVGFLSVSGSAPFDASGTEQLETLYVDIVNLSGGNVISENSGVQSDLVPAGLTLDRVVKGDAAGAISLGSLTVGGTNNITNNLAGGLTGAGGITISGGVNGTTIITGSGGGGSSTFNPNQFDTNGPGYVDLKFGALATNLTLRGTTTIDTGGIVNSGPATFNWGTLSLDSSGNITATANTMGIGGLTVSGALDVDGTSLLDNGAITTDGAGDITAVKFLGNGTNLTGVVNTNNAKVGYEPIFTGTGTGINGVTWVPSTNIDVVTSAVFSNIPPLTYYTNTSGSVQLYSVTISNQVAAVLGSSSFTFSISNANSLGWSNQIVGIGTVITSIAMNYTNDTTIILNTNAVLAMTNTSTGTGNVAGQVPGSGQIMTIGNATASGVASLGGNNTFTGNQTYSFPNGSNVVISQTGIAVNGGSYTGNAANLTNAQIPIFGGIVSGWTITSTTRNANPAITYTGAPAASMTNGSSPVIPGVFYFGRLRFNQGNSTYSAGSNIVATIWFNNGTGGAMQASGITSTFGNLPTETFSGVWVTNPSIAIQFTMSGAGSFAQPQPISWVLSPQ